MKEKFEEHKFTPQSLTQIQVINGILEDYRRMRFKLSLRQLYYQLVARDYIENSVRSYKRTGELVAAARLAGLIDWEMIEDRNRETVVNTHWASPAEIIRAAANGFRIDRWEGQPAYCEVMVEKDALSGILLPVCRELDIRFSANKGYSSASAMYEAGKRFRAVAMDSESSANEYHLFYLGDHDPSGIDMTRDVRERLLTFIGLGKDFPLQVHRLALNYDQVEQWHPPENPAKGSDSRYADYARRFGEFSWELDAVEPRTLATLLREAILEYIDPETWREVADKEARLRKDLERLADNYEAENDERYGGTHAV